MVPLVSFCTDRPRNWANAVLSEAATSIVDNIGAMGQSDKTGVLRDRSKGLPDKLGRQSKIVNCLEQIAAMVEYWIAAVLQCFTCVPQTSTAITEILETSAKRARQTASSRPLLDGSR